MRLTELKENFSSLNLANNKISNVIYRGFKYNPEVVKEDDKEYVIHGITSIDGQRIPLNQIPNWFNNDPGRGWEFANATEFQMVIDEILNIDSDGSKWKLTSLSAEEAINKFGKETVRIGFLKMRDNSVSVEVDSERSLKEAWYNPFTWFDNNKDTKQEFDKTKLLPTKPIRKAGEQLRDRKKLMKQQLDSLRKEMGEGLAEGLWGSIPSAAKAVALGAATGYTWNRFPWSDTWDSFDEPEVKRPAEVKEKPAYKADLAPTLRQSPVFTLPMYGNNHLERERLKDFRKHNTEFSNNLWNNTTDDYSAKKNLEEWKLWGRRLTMSKLINGELLLKDSDFVPTPWEQAILDYGFANEREFIEGGWAPQPVDLPIIEGVGIITAQNTTADVKPGETQRQAKKFGNIVDKDGRPPLLQKGLQSSELTIVKLAKTFKNLVK
jgi:hypothetical protein